MGTKICEKCGKKFKPQNRGQVLCHDCLRHPCVICGGPRGTLRGETCGGECKRKLRSINAKKIREERFKDRCCIICGKHIESLGLYVKTCGDKICKRRLQTITELNKGNIAICKRCGKEFTKTGCCTYCNYCSHERKCPICGSTIKGGRYETCGKKCAVILTQQLHGQEYKEYVKILQTKENREKAYAGRKGRPNPKNKGPKYNRRGENHPLRRGGKTLGTRRCTQRSPEYKSLIKEIYTRDDYTCQICGARGGTTLNVHHIRTRDYYPELRMDKNNLITLCEKCHKKVHRLGGGTHGATETFSILFKLTHEL